MKTRRIVSLLLAALMIVTALPLTAMVAFAAEAPAVPEAQAAGTPGTVPSTLPNGLTYAGVTLFGHDAAAKCRTAGNCKGWYGDIGTGVSAMLQDGAEGIMFRIDTSAAEEVAEDEILKMVFAISLNFTRKDGTTDSTYVISTPLQAAGWSANAVTTANDVSTWYYSQDGATWKATEETGASNTYVSIPVGKQVTYVFVPMSSFWTKEGETFLTTGTHDKTDNVVNWEDARYMIDNYYFESVRYLFSGNAWQDANTKVDQWQIVDHIAAVSDMTTELMIKDTVTVTPNSWSYGANSYVDNATGKMVAAKGMIFEVDSTAAPDDGSKLTFDVVMNMTDANSKVKNAYLCSTWARPENAFADPSSGDGTKANDRSSVFYWSEDGVNWTAVASSATSPEMPKARAKAYVYIPFESFWSRKSITHLSQGAITSASRVDAKDQIALLGEGWKFTYIYIYSNANSAACNAAKYSNWRFVYDSNEVSDQAPVKLPTGDYYTTKPYFSNLQNCFSRTLQHESWVGGLSSNMADGLNNAEGVMFKVDSSAIAAGTDSLSLWFAMSVTGQNGRTTYLMSNNGSVPNYSEAVKPSTSSVWYVSSDGLTWRSIISSNGNFPVSAFRGEFFVYIPYTSIYVKSGETFLKTGTNVKTEPGMSFLDARKTVGGWKSAGSFRMAIANTSMGNSIISHFQFVYKSNTPPTLPSKENLPVVGETLTTPVFETSGYTIPSGSLATLGTMNFKDAEGIMMEVDTTAMTGTNPLAFTFAISANTTRGGNGNNNYFFATARARAYGHSKVPADAISVWYWSEDGVNWKAYTSDATTDYMMLSAKRTKGYIYIPFTSFWSRYSADSISGVDAFVKDSSGNTVPSITNKPSVSYAGYMEAIGDNYKISYFSPVWNGMNTAGAKLMNWCYVDLDRTLEDATKAPTTLPDTGKEYVALPMLKPEYNEQKYVEGNYWQGNEILSSNVIPSIFEYANGIMMKVDTSAVAAGSDIASLSLILQVFLPNGKDTYICSSPGRAVGYGEAKLPTGLTSTWYVSNDGKNWTTLTGTSANASISAQRGILYLYIPASSMYVKCGETYLLTGSHNRTDTGKKDANENTVWDLHETVLSYTEANALCGGFERFGMVNLMINGNTVGKGLTVSDISLVGTPLRVFQNSSVSMTDDLNYNLYAKLPEGAENAQVVFTVGDKTYTSYGIVEADGRVRYTLSNILPQNLGKPITMTWTATVDGKEMTETYTESVLLYLNKILREESLSNWHDMAKAILHYGAAAQTYAGETGTLVNDGIGSTTAPVNVSKLPWTAVNYAPDVWKTWALRLDSSLNLKVGVTAPAGVTKVFYTVGERSGVVNIQNGYVYVPVYAYELMEPVTLRLWNGSTATLDGSLQVSVSAYLKSKYEDANATDELKALLQAIANYAQEATLLAGVRSAEPIAAPTLAQIELIDDGGMSYVIQLEDGSFIVIDGGVAGDNKINSQRLMQYLVEKSNYSTPVISAWMFTHQHGDHTNNAFYLLKNYASKLDVRMFAYSWAVEADLAIKDSDSDYVKGYKEQDIALITSKTKEFKEILAKYPNAVAWNMATGESKKIGTVTVDVLLTAADKVPSNPMELNDLSAAWKMTFAGGKTFMVLGDCSTERTAYLATTYNTLKSDVLQAAHHGLVGGEINTYKEIAPSITLVPTYEARFEDWFSGANQTDYNQWLLANSTCYHASKTTVVNMNDLSVSYWD